MGGKEKNGGSHVWRGEWRASRNGGWEGEFEGVCKMEVYLEVLLELGFFCTKPLNFGVETHMETLLELLLNSNDTITKFSILLIAVYAQ
jgi:hypothetical protein